MKTDGYVQIDVDQIHEIKQVAKCTLWTPEGSVHIYMKQSDYEFLKRNGFFVRDGKTDDGAGVINTTLPYYLKK